nr:hypothetical protein [uncultured archaeon]
MGGGRWVSSFQSRVLDSNAILGYAFKADIKHYFETVDHETLIDIIQNKIKDQDVLWLIRKILENHKIEIPGKGMPLGNLTSQFFANVYLHELDLFVKHKLKAKYYLRYVDDFVILHRNKRVLEEWKFYIDTFLRQHLQIELHPQKSSIILLRKGLTLLGFRMFYYYKLLKKSNMRRALKRLEKLRIKYDGKEITYEQVLCSLNGWFGYAKMGNTYNFRNKIILLFNDLFSGQ